MENWWVLDAGLGSRSDFIRLSIVAICAPLMLSQRSRVHAVLTLAVALVIIGVRFPVFGGSVGRDRRDWTLLAGHSLRLAIDGAGGRKEKADALRATGLGKGNRGPMVDLVR